jgi:hypothetical protein
VLPLLLLSGLVVIIPLAYAGPPDPTWTPGIYDNADYDDVAGFVTDGTAASSGQPPARVADGPETCEVLTGPGQVPSRMLCAEMNRGPPPIEREHHLGKLPTVSLQLVELAPPHGVLRSHQRHGSLMFGRPPPPVPSALVAGRLGSLILADSWIARSTYRNCGTTMAGESVRSWTRRRAPRFAPAIAQRGIREN